MIRAEYSGELLAVNPLDAYNALISLYKHFPDTLEKYGLQYPDNELQPDARLFKLDDKYGLVLKIKQASRMSLQESVIALLIEHPATSLSDHIASFKLSNEGLLSLNLPADYINLYQPALPGHSIAFQEKYSARLAGAMTIWFLDMAISKKFIPPPKLFISQTRD